MRFRFGSHSLDLEVRELLDGDGPVVLEPRAFDVLVYLLRNRDRVVPKEELLDEVWGDRFVGESALASQIKRVREAVGDNGRTQRAIRTAHRVGYRFVADVTVDQRSPVPPAASAYRRSPWPGGKRGELIGRDGDLDAVTTRLEEHQLVTILGPGGIGKTSLAAHLLDRLAPSMPEDGVWMCELVHTRNPSVVGNVVLEAVGEGQQSDADPEESLLRALEHRKGVLVLDNCEHVMDVVGSLATGLTQRCPDLRVVSTSRVSLGVAGESVYELAPLTADDAKTCFVSHATARGATVVEDDPALDELCRRLDGLPLALELAATRTRVLSPAEMLDLLDDRFRLLRDSRHGTDERHRSLYCTMEWSWDGLEDQDRQLLAELTVFVGSFTIDDLRAVSLPDVDALDALDAVGRLVDHSLVVSVSSPAVRTRFRLLESVRDFASAQLPCREELRRRHVRHFVTVAEALDAQLQTEELDAAIRDMHDAWPGLRAAVGYAVDLGDTDSVRRIIRAVGGYANLFQIFEILDWCEGAGLDAVQTSATTVATEDTGSQNHPVVAAEALAVKASMLAHRGHVTEARAMAEAAHAHQQSHATLLSVVLCAYYTGDLELVERSVPRLRELSRSARGFDHGFAEGLAATVVADDRRVDLASTTVTAADADKGVQGTLDCLTTGLRLLALDPDGAVELLQAVVDSSIRNDYRLLIAAASGVITSTTLPGRPIDEATRILHRTVRAYLERGMWVPTSAATVTAAQLLEAAGDTETACRLLGARAASGYSGGLSEAPRALLEDDLRARLGDRYAELAEQGATWRPPEAGQVAIDALARVLERAAP